MRTPDREDLWFSYAIHAVIVGLVIKVIISGNITWPSVGALISAGLFWAPHAYFRNKENKNYHSISHNNKKIESLTTSLNLLSLKLKEVEKTSQAAAKAQGFSNLNRKYTL
jgi:hypothetical protein